MTELLMRAQVGDDLTVPRYHLVDLVVGAPDCPVDANPYDVVFEAVFCGPSGKILTIPGFFDSQMGYVVRFSPEAEGTWTYTFSSSIAAHDGREGEITCVAGGDTTLRGALRVDPDHAHHFLNGDGTHCFLMGYEANWLMMVDQNPSDLTRINEFLDDLTTYGFNMVTVNGYAYLHPMRWDRAWQKSGDPIFATPTLSPWAGTIDEPDYGQMNAPFFEHHDRIMVEILKRGIYSHLMLQVYNKDIDWPELCSEDDNRYWRYFMARYQAFSNIILDPAKETFNRPATYVQDRIALMRSLDGYGRIMTVHDPSHMWSWHDWPYHRRFAEPERDLADDMVDFKSDQIHLFWYEDALRNYQSAERPYVNIEYGYERGVQEIPTANSLRMQHWREVLRRSWLVTMGGGYINYYYMNTAWTVFIHRPIPAGYGAHRAYRDFWEQTRYWLLAPDNSPLGQAEQVYCRCDPGREYVVFDEAGQGFELDLPGDSAYRAQWFNPVGDEYLDLGPILPGKQSFSPAFGRGNWSVLHLERS